MNRRKTNNYEITGVVKEELYRYVVYVLRQTAIRQINTNISMNNPDESQETGVKPTDPLRHQCIAYYTIPYHTIPYHTIP